MDPPPPRRVQPVGKSPRSLMLGYFTHGTVHLSALAHLTVLSGPDRLRRPPSPTHSVAARGRSRGFHRASGNIRPSDSSTSVPSHFALAYRVGCRGATRGPAEVSQGHALVFRTVPSAYTLVRWVDESAFASIVQARPCPTFGRPVRHGVAPSTTARYCSANPSDPTSRWAPCLPQFRRGGSRSTLAVSGFRLRARVGVSIPATCGRRGITPAFGYGPPSFGGRRDLNLPDQCAAWRTLRASPPPCTARPDPRGLSVGACHATARASRVASIPLFHACRRHYPGGIGRCLRRSLPDPCQPSSSVGRVGFRINRFEACSAFARATARMVAGPPKAALRHQSASADVVTSIVRSDCYRLERQLPGGIRTR